MAEDQGDKTEDPTPRKLQEAREQGKVARSKDLGTAVLIIGSMMMLKYFGAGVMDALKMLVGDRLGEDAMADTVAANALAAIFGAVVAMGIALAPMMIGIVLIIVIVDLLQVGLNFNSKRLQPNLAALNPVKGLGRVFGKGRSPIQGAISLAKIVLVSLVAYSAIHDRLLTILLAQQLSFIEIFGLGAEVVYAIGIRIGVVLLILALIEYAYQRYRIAQELKMTKQEVKDEMRRMDGDPKIKQRRKQLAMQMMKEQLKKDIPTADVIVTNPTHFSVALKYDAGNMHAPRVIAKGQDFIALRIREIAIANGVPILERPPLARALYKLVEVGQEIPEQYYAAVAEILAYVYELNGAARKRAS
jgi:flagellar biosynthetic protein FlhB